MALICCKNTRLSSYNCRGLKLGKDYLKTLLDRCEVCLIQEHWLLDSELHLVNNVHNDFIGFGRSAVDSSSRMMKDNDRLCGIYVKVGT